MKKINKELRVDVIGGMGALTKEDERAISEFIKQRKKSQVKRKLRLNINKSKRRKKVTVKG